MGNLCSWCLKNQDDSQTNENNNNANNNYSSGIANSERSSEYDERTPLIGKSDGHNHHTANGDSSTIAPPLPQIINETKTETTTVPSNETAETKMAFIVEGMLSKLIDVGGSNLPQTALNPTGFNNQNDNLKHLLNKTLISPTVSPLPDAGVNNLPSLLSGRPISSDICHFVAHTAGELSHLLIDEIKIVHKEDLVVVFE